MALSAAALIFGFNAIRETADVLFSTGFTTKLGAMSGSQPMAIVHFGTAVVIICVVVHIMMRSFEDNAVGRHMERHDALTGLPNRSNLQHKLESILAEENSAGALILVDPTRLRSINTTLGREAGDTVFRECAKRLEYFFEKPNFVAVSSNGTLAIYVKGVEHVRTINALSGEIRKALKLPIRYDSRFLYTNMTTGAVLFTSSSISAEELLNRAELALLEAKASLGTEPVIFNAGLYDNIKRRSSLETELQEVLELEKLEPFFQPLFMQDGKTLYGFEALARWKHPSKGWISPTSFIPVAEELKLTAKLGCQMLRKACERILPLEGMRVSVNVTPTHLMQEGFVRQVAEILEESGLPPDRLELEITESVLLNDTEEAEERIRTLKALGVSIALDDFGTGYSSLSYLNKFSVDRIKVDASFIKAIDCSGEGGAMVELIINLARERDIAVTVEGVETGTQLEFLNRFDGLIYQGYLFSPPLCYEDLLKSDLMRQRDVVRFVADNLQQRGAHLNVVTLNASGEGARAISA